MNFDVEMFYHNYRHGKGWTIEAPVFWYSYIRGVCVWRIPAGVLCVLYSRLEMVTASIGDPNGHYYLLLVVCPFIDLIGMFKETGCFLFLSEKTVLSRKFYIFCLLVS